MNRRSVRLMGLLAVAAIVTAASTLRLDEPRSCSSCAEWNRAHEPFRVYGNSYYVGVAGLASVLVASDEGHVLLDGGLPQSVPLIDANIRRLGFRTEDVRLILSSHAHFDHAGGIAALQRASGATVAASAAGASALERGDPLTDDPQYGFGHDSTHWPPVKGVRVVKDGETLRVGDLAITAHLTPGHTPGSTTWTWRSCEAERCLDIVYADSLNSISAPGFRYTGDATHPSVVQTFRHSISAVAGLPCDVLLTVHPEFSEMDEKLGRRAQKPETDPFIDRQACRTYAGAALSRLEQRIAEEAR